MLRSVFGYKPFRGRQQEIVEQWIAGGSAPVLMQREAEIVLLSKSPASVAGLGGVDLTLIA